MIKLRCWPQHDDQYIVACVVDVDDVQKGDVHSFAKLESAKTWTCKLDPYSQQQTFNINTRFEMPLQPLKAVSKAQVSIDISYMRWS